MENQVKDMLFGQDSAVVMGIIIYKLMDIILLHFTQYPTESLTLIPKIVWRNSEETGFFQNLFPFPQIFNESLLCARYCVLKTQW